MSEQKHTPTPYRHEDLLAACRAALDALEETLEDTDGPDGEMVPNPLLVQLRAAIALAEGKAT